MIIVYLYADKIQGGASRMLSAYIDVLTAKDRDVTLVVRKNSSLHKTYCKKHGVKCVILNSRTALGLLVEGKRRLKNLPCDVVFAVNAYHAIYVKLVGLRSKIILNHWLVRKGFMARTIQFLAAYLSEEFVFEYFGQKDDVYGRHYDAKNLVVVNTPVSGIGYKCRDSLNSPKNGLFMSALSYRKGIHRFLWRNSDLIKRKDLKVRIAGAPVNVKQRIYTLALKAGISVLGLERNVIFLGWQSEVEHVLNQADFFLITSYSEGLSGSLRKAIMNGLPVYATNVGGNASLICDGENGLVDDGLMKFEVFYNSIGDYYKLTQNHSAYVSRNYSLERFRNLINELIE
jgi:glycosyltransferase involved in cell wall biosynthesis